MFLFLFRFIKYLCAEKEKLKRDNGRQPEQTYWFCGLNQRSLHYPCGNGTRWRGLRTTGYEFDVILFPHAALLLYLGSVFQIIRRPVRIHPTKNKQIDYSFSFLLSKCISNEIHCLEDCSRSVSTACVVEWTLSCISWTRPYQVQSTDLVSTRII